MSSLARNSLFVALCCLLACGGGTTSGTGSAERAQTSVGPTSTNPNVTVQTTQVYYDIFGNSITQLRQELSNKGPGAYFGRVDSTISYDYKAGGSCVVASARARVDSQLTLPRWDMPANAAPSLVAEWNRFIAALERHELNHVEIDVTQAEIFWATVFELPAFPDCAALDNAIAELHQRALQRAGTLNQEYDQRTQHGVTEGATL